MKAYAKKLRAIVRETKPLMQQMNLSTWEFRAAPTKWSKKQILGHLIDSAANNHQRFVRVQFEDNPAITYNADKWVATQNYNNALIENLIDLWASYNKHLAHVISEIPEKKFDSRCDINQKSMVTLKWLVNDYIRHLEHHMEQIIA